MKLAAGSVAAYALSPIDLIPDSIPVIGYLDDLLLVPLGILLVVRIDSEAIMHEFSAAAARTAGEPLGSNCDCGALGGSTAWGSGDHWPLEVNECLGKALRLVTIASLQTLGC